MSHVATLSTLCMLFFIPVPIGALRAATTSQETPLVIAHRGASGYLPEHTLPAIAMAHAQGADFIEQDVVLSQDDQPIVIHDKILDYVTNAAQTFPDRKRNDGHYYVADFTLAELRTLRVHERTDPRSGKLQYPARFPLGKSHFSLATLAEHVELIEGLNHSSGHEVGLLVELKDPAWHRAQGKDLSQAVLKTLSEYGYKTREDNTILQCFDLDEIRRLREELHTDLRLVQLMNEQTLKLPRDASREQIATALEKLAGHADGIGPSLELLLSRSRIPGDPQLNELVELAHKAGLVVYCYTFRADGIPQGFTNFAELVEFFSEARIDGFITDHADKVRELLPASVR